MPVFFDFETLIGRRGRPRTFTRFFEIGAVCLRSSRMLSMLVDPVVEWDITDAQSLVMAVYESGMNPKPSIRFWARTLKRKGHPYFLKRYKHYFRRRDELTPLQYLETTTDLVYAHSLRDVIVNGRQTTVRGENDVFGIHDPFDAILELQSIIKDEGDNTLIAHNGKSFDFHVLRGAISRNFNKMAMFKDVKMVDSIGVFRKAMPEFKTYRQPFLYSTIFGEQYDAHIAIDDARALKRLWCHIVKPPLPSPKTSSPLKLPSPAMSCSKMKVSGRSLQNKKVTERPIVSVIVNEVPQSDRVTSIPGIGPSTARSLAQIKVKTVPELYKLWKSRKKEGKTLKGIVRFWRKVEKYLEEDETRRSRA
jgi:hypothetical protein